MVKKIETVIHLPTSVGGNPQGISDHFNQLGLKSVSWAFVQNQFNYKVDKYIWKKTDSRLICELKRICALRYIFLFDAIFFNYGSSLYPCLEYTPNKSDSMVRKLFKKLYYIYYSSFQKLELTLLKTLRKKIFIQFQGDDARQGDYCRNNFAISSALADPDHYSSSSDEARRKHVKFMCKYSSNVFALNPDLMHILPANTVFLPYSHISLSVWTPSYSQMDDRPLRICHAPSDRKIKGTQFIIEAIESLRAKGYLFELVLVEGVSNDDAKALYQTADVFIDQLFCGWYGGVAVEAMALGKPVICYLREDDLKFIPSEMRSEIPIINATSDSIEDVLRHVLEMPRFTLYQIALRSRLYVEKWHDPCQIAVNLMQQLQKD